MKLATIDGAGTVSVEMPEDILPILNRCKRTDRRAVQLNESTYLDIFP